MKSGQDDIANIIDTCLDSLLSGQATLDEILARYPEEASELRANLEASIRFNKYRRSFDAAVEIKSSQKVRLIKAIKANPQSIADPAKSVGFLGLLRSFFNPRTYQLVGSIALVFLLLFSSTVGFAFAAKNSIPGDLLYQPKLSIEKAALALSLSDTHDASLQVEYTDRRMDEVEAVIQTNRLGYLSASVERYQEQVEVTIKKIISTSFHSQVEKSRVATQLKVILETHSVLINALATTIPGTYQDDLARVASITQETLVKTSEIIEQPLTTPISPTQPISDRPTASWTPTASLPAPSPTRIDPSPTIVTTPIPTFGETPIPLILPGASPTPTPTSTLTTAPSKPELPAVVPTRKPTKTPKLKPTRNPHYTPPSD